MISYDSFNLFHFFQFDPICAKLFEFDPIRIYSFTIETCT